MTRRTAFLFALLLALVGLVTWRPDPLALLGEAPEPAADGAEAAAPADVSALSLERYPGRVADAASALLDFSDTLEWLATSCLEDLGIDVHVVTLAAPDLPAETLAPEVFALRKVGADAPTGGLLVLLNPARQEARIEVSYTLEPVLTDALVGRIAHDQLAPYAAYRFSGMAVMDALHFLKDFVLQQAIEGRLDLADAYRARPAYIERARFLSGGGGASVRVPSAEELATRDLKARIADRARYAPSDRPEGSAEAFLRVQRDLAGDPSLELFTEGSQCMRRGYPVAPYEEIERARRLEAAKPWRAIVSGDRAVVTSESPPRGFVPVLLHRVDGLWRVDLVETWKSLFFNERGEYWLKNASTPYAFGLGAYGSGEPQDLAPWDLGDSSIEEVLASLAARGGALSEFLQGEVLFRNCFRADALAHYQKASESARGSLLFSETLGRRAEYLGFRRLALDAYARMSVYGAVDAARVHAEREDFASAARALQPALERNPRDAEVLAMLQRYLQASDDLGGAREIGRRLDALAAEPPRRNLPVGVRFDPPVPLLDIDAPTLVGTTRVFDHSFFRVTLDNPSDRPVVLDRVLLKTSGSADSSGLGDIRGYWDYPSGAYRIAPGESVALDKTWGYTVDTKNEQVRYVFDVCWHGEGEPRQCRVTSLDLFPR
ncbi:MAG TPA: TPM domain-containing protein [Myxococcota bacterium]|nr:TPM domain-containing protein [Myxococcota bacterium]